MTPPIIKTRQELYREFYVKLIRRNPLITDVEYKKALKEFNNLYTQISTENKQNYKKFY